MRATTTCPKIIVTAGGLESCPMPGRGCWPMCGSSRAPHRRTADCSGADPFRDVASGRVNQSTLILGRVRSGWSAVVLHRRPAWWQTPTQWCWCLSKTWRHSGGSLLHISSARPADVAPRPGGPSEMWPRAAVSVAWAPADTSPRAARAIRGGRGHRSRVHGDRVAQSSVGWLARAATSSKILAGREYRPITTRGSHPGAST